MAKKTIPTPFGDIKVVSPQCKDCKKDELRDLVYAILDTLPTHLVTDYAHEKLELMTYDGAMEAAADGAEYAREGREG